jgi:hypothetical protein
LDLPEEKRKNLRMLLTTKLNERENKSTSSNKHDALLINALNNESGIDSVELTREATSRKKSGGIQTTLPVQSQILGTQEGKPVDNNDLVASEPTDFGLYKCQACGKMVMGYDKEKHMKDAHRGRSVDWIKIK